MGKIHLDGTDIKTSGDLPKIGDNAPNFELITTDFKVITLESFANKNIILNIFPSADTDTCSSSIKKFNHEASKLKDTIVICASMDSPFAYLNYSVTNDISNIIVGSDIRNRSLGANYGLTIIDSPLAGLLARAIIVIDKNHKVTYTELVSDISNSPNYEKALLAVHKE